ncbi:MAG: sugar-binding protein [Verrucomicrobiae bacterium]|nr:sugar-binding protein [Verrucomicrobiae bacterium]
MKPKIHSRFFIFCLAFILGGAIRPGLLKGAEYFNIVFPDETANVFLASQGVNFRVIVKASTPSIIATLECQIKDADEKVIGSSATAVEIPYAQHPAYRNALGVNPDCRVNLPVKRNGSFTLRVALKDRAAKLLGEERKNVHVVAGPPDDDAGSFFGVCGGDGVMERLMGVKWISQEVAWPWVEPEKGVFCWQIPDRFIARQQARNLQVKGMLNKCTPWARRGDPSKELNPGKLELKPPRDMAEWGQYVAKTVDHYRDKIVYWDLWPEPGCGWQGTLPEYVELMKVAYETAKKVNPKCKIIASADTGYITSAHGYLKQLFENGAMPYFDILGIHPYCGSSSPEAQQWEERFQELVNLMEKHGGAKPIWATEVGWPTGSSVISVDERTQANYLVRMYALGLNTPHLEKLFWFLISPYGKGDRWGVLEKDRDGLFQPRPAFFAYAAMADILSGAVCKRAVFPKDVRPRMTRCHLFEKKDVVIAMVWRTGAAAELPVSMDHVGQVKDLYGNPMEIKQALSISESPAYLIFKRGAKMGEIEPLFANASVKILGAEPLIAPLACVAEPLRDEMPGVKQVDFQIRNQTGGELKGAMEAIPPASWKLAQASQTFKLPAEEKRKYSFHVAAAAPAPFHEYPFSLRAMLKDDPKAVFEFKRSLDFPIAKFFKTPPKIDGDLADWRGQYPVHPLEWLTGSKDFKGENDLQATAYTGWDENCFYFACRVYDDVFVQDGKILYGGDSVQIAFDAGNNAKSASYDGDDYEFTFALAADGPRFVCNQQKNVKEVRFAARKFCPGAPRPYEICYEAAIPFSCLPPLPSRGGTDFGFSLVVLDNDSPDALAPKGGIQYGGGIACGKDPQKFVKWKLAK